MGVYLYAKGAGVVRAATEAYPAENDTIDLGKIAWNVGGEYCGEITDPQEVRDALFRQANKYADAIVQGSWLGNLDEWLDVDHALKEVCFALARTEGIKLIWF
jgi:hypothetical protein